MSMTNANQRQVGGRHYQSAIQHWDYAATHNFDYFQGQITKYVTRWKQKGGIADLEKAQHFLQKYIEVEKQKLPTVGVANTAPWPKATLDKAQSELKESIRRISDGEGYEVDPTTRGY